MALPIDRLVIDGEKLDARVESNLAPESELLRTMDGASTLTLVVHDQQGELLETGALTKRRSRGDTFGDAAWTRLGKVQLSLDGAFFRLAGVSKTGTTLTLTFEDEIVALLRQHHRFVRSNRKDITRAQFVSRLVATPKPHILKHIPAIDKRQRIANVDVAETKVGQQGISRNAHITIKDTPADREQIRNLNLILDQAAEDEASERATIAMLCAAIAESSVRAIPNSAGSGYAGVFQANPANVPMNATALQAHYFLVGGKGFQGGGAKKLAAQHPNWEPGQIALVVEGSRSNFAFFDSAVKFYNKYKDEAAQILDAYGGAGRNVTTRERYVYKAGSHGDTREDYWQAVLRLAEEVNWRAFTANNVFFYAADKDLMRAEPFITIAEQPSAKDIQRGVQYVGNLDFDWHYNKPVGEVTGSIAADRWVAYPGSVSEIVGLGPAAGRWLNWEFRQRLGSVEMNFTLKRPAPDKPEPAPGVRRTAVPAPADVKGYVKNSRPGSPIPGIEPHAPTHPTAGLPGYPAYDYMAPAGTKVVAPEDGRIARFSGKDPKLGGPPGGPLGYSIYLDGESGRSYFLTHLGSRTCHVGDRVKQGQQIGTVANGPPSWSQPHCHMGVHTPAGT